MLDAERAALTGDCAETVAAHAADKTALLGRLEGLETERRSLCGDHRDANASEAIRVRWRSLMAVMANCRQANEVNGYIVNVRHGQVRQLLDVLRGGPATTYGPQGKTLAPALRALARA